LEADRAAKAAPGAGNQVALQESHANLLRLQALAAKADMSHFSIRHPLAWVPDWQHARTRQSRVEALRELLITAIAVKRHCLRASKLPPDLNAVVPEFLPTVPRDPMDGQPLRYRVEPDGSWRLYSVGLDRHDDGGRPDQPNAGTPSERDIVLPMPAP
jgi:hypothetical protein